MALIKDDKVYRNLQEQVYENTCDIQELLRMYGYHGPYTSTDVIPNDDLYNRAMYLIGTGMPYKVYQYSDLTKRFTYIGDYNMDVGPEGPPGPQGPQGERGPDGKPASEILNIETYDVIYKKDVTESKVRANFDDGHSNEFSVYAKNGESDISNLIAGKGITVEHNSENTATISVDDTIIDTDKLNDKLNEELPKKQDKLTPGKNISIVDNVISSTGGLDGVVGGTGITVENTADDKAIVNISNDVIDKINESATKDSVNAVASDLSNHTSNDTIHVTAENKTEWSNKVNQEQIADMATKTELASELAKKQDVITDLDTIRSGASAGATAVQPTTLDNYVTLDTVQTITGLKTFDIVTANNYEAKAGVSSNYIQTVTLNATNNITTPKIYADEIVSIGKIFGDDTSHLFIRHDGSITFEKEFNTTDFTTLNLPKKVGIFTLATTDDIDSAHSDINNSISDIEASIPNMVTTNTAQTITGPKTFQSTVTAPNLTAQGTNQSTVYGGVQIVHTFDDNTKLNLQYPKKSGNQTIATVSDLNTGLSGKLDKVTDTTELGQVYYKTPSGANGMINCNTLQTSLPSLLMRDEYGNCKITDPLDEWDITNKRYVDNAVASFDTSNLVTLNTEQTITANKNIQGKLNVQGSFSIKRADNTTAFSIYNNQEDRILLEGWKQVGNSYVRSRYNLPIADTDIHKTIATTDQLPDTSKFVTTDTAQTISGHKIFDDGSIDVAASGNTGKALRLYNGGIGLYDAGTSGPRLAYLTLPRTTGTLALTSDIPTDYVSLTGDQTIGGKKTYTGGIIAANFTAQGSNQSTVYSGTQFVHTFADNTKLNLQFPKKSGNKTIATTDDIYYQNNEKFVNTGFYNANGYLTGGGKEIGFTITLPKNLKNIKTITVNKLSCNVRGIGGYLNGSGYIDYTTQTGITVNAYKAADNAVFIQIKMSNTTWGGTNNTPVAVAFAQASTLDITFKS